MYGDFAGMYDPLMKDVDYDSWAEYLLRFLGAEKLRVTDCACGTGAVSIPLAKRGYKVTGLDASEEMLRIAAENARAERERSVCLPGYAPPCAAQAGGRGACRVRRGELPYAKGRGKLFCQCVCRAEGRRNAAV